MSTPYIGEIRMFGFGTRGAPNGWQQCDGSLLSIAEYDALFALIGTTYGGDGQVTFGMPDLRGRLPIHQGQGPGLSNYVIGQKAGVENVTLTSNQIPAHTHGLVATTNQGNVTNPGSGVVLAKPVDAGATPVLYYVPGTVPLNKQAMASTAVSTAGGGQSHTNMMPALTVMFCIATQGIFPTQA